MTREMSSSNIVPAREGGDLCCWALGLSLSSADERDLLALLYVEVDVVVVFLVSVVCFSDELLCVSSS